MANAVGTVKSIEGSAIATSPSGEVRLLQVGDTVFAGEVVTNQSLDGSITLSLLNGKEITLKGKDILALDDSVVNPDSFGNESNVAANSISDAQKAILEGKDLENLDETAAGEEGVPGGGMLSEALFLNIDNESNVYANENSTNLGNSNSDIAVTGNLADNTNHAPIVENAQATTLEDTPVTINVLQYATDPDGDPLRVSSASSPDGEVVINGDGTITFIPDQDYNGRTTITYTIDDGRGGEGTGVIETEVTPVNDNPTVDPDPSPLDPANPPVAGTYDETTPEDTPLTSRVSATDVDGDPLTFTKASDPSNGSVVVNSDGTYTYTPDEDYNGNDSFTIAVDDGNGGVVNIPVNIIVTPVNDDPDANDDFAQTDENVAVTVNVLANDTDVDGDELTVTSATSSDGSVVVNPDGTITFTPNDGFVGDTTATYTISDGNGGTDTATVYITVNPVSIDVTVDAPDNTEDPTPTITGTTDATPGSTVVVTVTDADGGTQTITTTVQPDGTFTADTPNPIPDGTYTATADVTDPDGRTGSGSDTGSIADTTAPSAPTVEIIDPNGDGVINDDEADNGIQATIRPPADSAVGDTLHVDTDGDGNDDFTKTLTQDDIDNGVTITVPTDDVPTSGTLTVDATVEDDHGNTSPKGTDSIAVDTDIPNDGVAPTVLLTDDINNDGFINKVEYETDGNDRTDVQVSFDGTKVDVGDIVVVTDNTDPSNSVTKEIVIDAKAKADGHITTDFATQPEGSKVVVNAIIKDTSGNETAQGEDTAKLDRSDLTNITDTITDDTDNNGLISKAELGTDGKIAVEIDLPDNVAGGDKLVVTGTGNSYVEIILDTNQISAGKVTVEFNAPANGTKFITTAQVTDTAGNQSDIATDEAILKTDEPGAPTVVITEDDNKNGYISADELNGEVDVKVTVPTGTQVGDTLTIDSNTNTGSPETVNVTQDIIDNGITTTFPAPAEGDTITVTATVKDGAGNVSPEGSASAILDTSDLTTGLAINIDEDENNDGYISQAELKDNDIDVTVTLPTDSNGNVTAGVGDTLTVTGSVNTPQYITITQAHINAGEVKVSFPNVPTDGNDFTTTASIKDIAGNESENPVSDMATMQLTAPGEPIVTITEDYMDKDGNAVTGGDGWINSTELQGDIDISVVIPATAAAGDTMYLDVNGDGTADDSHLLTLADIQAGTVAFTTPNPGEGVTLTADAWVIDKAGNKSEVGTDSATIDTTPPATAPTIKIDIDDSPDDGLISSAEHGTATTTDVSVGIPADAQNGDIITVTDGAGKTLDTFTVGSNGVTAGSTQIISDVELPAKGETLEVTASIKDVAGNEGPSTTDSAKLDETIEVINPDAKTNNVSEEGLVGGIKDTAGTPNDTTDDASSTNKLNVTNADTLNIKVDDVNSGLTADGKTIIWDTTSETKTLTGYTTDGSGNKTDVIKVSIDNDGNYEVDLLKPIDHPDKGVGIEDVISTTVTLVASNSVTGSQATDTLTVNIEDDAPESAPDTSTITVDKPAENTNLLITLDLSSSMYDNNSGTGVLKPDGTEYNRLELMQKSVHHLIDSYEKYGGDVKVSLVVFGKTGHSIGNKWISADDARDIVDNIKVTYNGVWPSEITINGVTSDADDYARTNYDAALAEVKNSYTQPANGQTISYFLTDGDPSGGDSTNTDIVNEYTKIDYSGINSAEKAIWDKFLSDNGIDESIAVGIGNVKEGKIEPIASSSENTITVTSFDKFDAALQGTIKIPATEGNLIGDSKFGADGGDSFSVTVNGKTYIYDISENKIYEGGVEIKSGSVLEDVVTSDGSKITIYMADDASHKMGDFSYIPSLKAANGTSEVINYTLKDNDGDEASSKTTLEVTDIIYPTITNNLPIEGDNRINADEAKDTVISGTTTDAEEGQTVHVTITDADDKEITTTATVDKDGNWTTSDLDLSTLKDGNLTVNSEVSDTSGNTISDTDTVILDTVKPTITITDNGDNGDTWINKTESQDTIIRGTTNAEEGQTVHVTITDESGKEIKTTAIVDDNGEWTADSVNTDGLTDGKLDIKAEVSDKAGNVADPAEADVKLDTIAPEVKDLHAEDTTVSGKTTDNATKVIVEVYEKDSNGDYVLSKTIEKDVKGGEDFSVNIPKELNDEQYVKVTTIDAAGNLSKPVHLVYAGDIMNENNSHIYKEVSYEDLPNAGKFGDGDDVLIVTDTAHPNDLGTIELGAKIDMGAGNDTIKVDNHILGTGTEIKTGDGKDIVEIGTKETGFLADFAKLDTGSGDDYVHVTGQIDRSGKLNTGSGDDTVVVDDSIADAGTKVDLGSGNDNLTVKHVGNEARINGGEGDDTIAVESIAGYIDGGSGSDTLVINNPSSTVHFINLATYTKSIENVKIGGTEAVKLVVGDLNVKGITEDDSTILKIQTDNPNVIITSSVYADWKVASSQDGVEDGYTRFEAAGVFIDVQNTVKSVDGISLSKISNKSAMLDDDSSDRSAEGADKEEDSKETSNEEKHSDTSSDENKDNSTKEDTTSDESKKDSTQEDTASKEDTDSNEILSSKGTIDLSNVESSSEESDTEPNNETETSTTLPSSNDVLDTGNSENVVSEDESTQKDSSSQQTTTTTTEVDTSTTTKPVVVIEDQVNTDL